VFFRHNQTHNQQNHASGQKLFATAIPKPADNPLKTRILSPYSRSPYPKE